MSAMVRTVRSRKKEKKKAYKATVGIDCGDTLKCLIVGKDARTL